MPSRARLASSPDSMPLREVSTLRRPSDVEYPALVEMTSFGARDDVAQHSAEHRLGLALGVGRRGVDQGPAAVHEGAEQPGGILLIGLPRPGHGAKGEGGHAQPTVADITLLHASKLTGLRAAS